MGVCLEIPNNCSTIPVFDGECFHSNHDIYSFNKKPSTMIGVLPRR